jgi:hypothetical protein
MPSFRLSSRRGNEATIGNGWGNVGLAPLLGAIHFYSHTGGLHYVPTSGYCLATLPGCVPGASPDMRSGQQPAGFQGAFSNAAFPSWCFTENEIHGDSRRQLPGPVPFLSVFRPAPAGFRWTPAGVGLQ